VSLAVPTSPLIGATLSIGDHITRKWFGLTVNVDVVWSTLIAGAVLLILGYLVARKATSGVPGRLQLAWETIVTQVEDLVESSIGPAGRSIVPLALTLGLFILLCNWIELIPSGHNPEYLPAPTADVNLPAAMAVFVIVGVHIYSIRARGLRKYTAHYFQPYKAMFPINVIEEITKPITLTFRLFGNLFSGGLMIAVMASLLPIYILPVGELVWKPFDMFIGAIQAFIFALLTVIYFSMAMSTEDH